MTEYMRKQRLFCRSLGLTGTLAYGDLAAPTVLAAGESALPQQALARHMPNPTANLISLPVQNNTSFHFSPQEHAHHTLTF